MKRIISLLLCFSLLIGAVAVTTVNAADYKTGSNAVSDSYKRSKYYKNFTEIELTGDGRRDLLAVALSQLGYQESGTANRFDGVAGGSSSNFTEYNYNMGDFGVGYGGGSYPWCASFVAWCLLQSGNTTQNRIGDWCRYHIGEEGYIWREVSCTQWARQLERFDYFEVSQYRKGTYQPLPGDLIFFTWDGAVNSEDHIGIVVYCESGYVYTVEGNTADSSGLQTNGDGVYFKKYALSDYRISGYGVLPYKTVEGLTAIDYSNKNPTGGLYIAERPLTVYETPDSTKQYKKMQRFTVFNVLGITETGRVKIEYQYAGKTIAGYVEYNNASERMIQLTEGEITMKIACVDAKGKELYSYEVTGKSGDEIEIETVLISGYATHLPDKLTVKCNGGTYELLYYPYGDVHLDGDINAFDYALVKRAVLNTHELSEDAAIRANVVVDDKIDAFDYGLLKRVVLGTAVITGYYSLNN